MPGNSILYEISRNVLIDGLFFVALAAFQVIEDKIFPQDEGIEENHELKLSFNISCRTTSL